MKYRLPEYKPTRLIFGMVPWMFWTLLLSNIASIICLLIAGLRLA